MFRRNNTMPFFKSNSNDHTERASSTSPKRSMFSGSNSSRSPPLSNSNSNGGRKGIFGRRSNSSDTDDQTDSLGRSGGGLFGRSQRSGHGNIRKDPSIIAAREKVAQAENSERQADAALAQARISVKEARRHVEFLEREALEESQRAKMKQAEAKNVRKSAKGLGRHN